MQQSFVLPYFRNSPIHIPRRDMVLAGSDSVLLSVSIIESDDPAAEALVITGGIGGPALRMTVWPDSSGWCRDYGMWWPVAGNALWSGVGTVSTTARGTYDVLVPIATMINWPLRCVYALQLDWSGDLRSETLAQGLLHIRRFAINGPGGGVGGGGSPDGAGAPLMTDDWIPVLTDDDVQVLV